VKNSPLWKGRGILICGGGLFSFVVDEVEPAFPVPRELLVAADEGHAFGYGLRDDHSVGGVAVVFEKREFGEGFEVLFGDVFEVERRFIIDIINDIFGNFPLFDMDFVALQQVNEFFYALGRDVYALAIIIFYVFKNVLNLP
jgi:hypothetical protein